MSAIYRPGYRTTGKTDVLLNGITAAQATKIITFVRQTLTEEEVAASMHVQLHTEEIPEDEL